MRAFLLYSYHLEHIYVNKPAYLFLLYIIFIYLIIIYLFTEESNKGIPMFPSCPLECMPGDVCTSSTETQFSPSSAEQYELVPVLHNLEQSKNPTSGKGQEHRG